MEYMLDTNLDKVTDYQMDYLDGIHWIRVPLPTLAFTHRGRFSVRCGCILDSERSSFTEQLSLYKNFFELRRPQTIGHLLSESLGLVNTERGNYVDRTNRYSLP